MPRLGLRSTAPALNRSCGIRSLRHLAGSTYPLKSRTWRMFLFGIGSALIGLLLTLWGVLRGEWQDRLPHAPEGRWRLVVGGMVVAGGMLLTAVAVVVSQLAPPVH
jgi:hypothetical protein